MDLSDAYSISKHTPGFEAYPPLWAQKAEAFRNRLSETGHARLGLAYGDGTRQALDLFLPEGSPRGLVVFVHGGYWLAFDRSSWSHLAEGARARGSAVALPSYDLCPTVRITDITRQVAQAVTFAAREVPGPIRLTGHSAGGHLVARMAAPGILPDEIAARLAHILPISPLTDLAPLMQTAMNADLRIDAAEARAESPVHQAKPRVPVTIWVGANERPALLDQSERLANAWGCGHVVEPGKHHFDVIEGLEDPGGPMVARLLS
ncbi:alpha/beta hydrolase [Thetidibacter halocola]|uniref:Alpha/beta hydrolase n=1 Tax=Thetidibacter halocola TaxID=2827239 RepID=A0A8J7WFC1_9RHOB|nr:alpha/beta hydrolase [Thetidibacter halocola]MBS0125772.1 alpha/beta hydrolase [Thetidibacter halocola]